jgi:hypothetical protein
MTAAEKPAKPPANVAIFQRRSNAETIAPPFGADEAGRTGNAAIGICGTRPSPTGVGGVEPRIISLCGFKVIDILMLM